MGDFDDLLGGGIPDREPRAPEEDVEPLENVPELPHATRSQRRAIKAYAIDNMKKEGCTCQHPYPKITFVDGDVVEEDVPDGAVRFNSVHQQTCTWLQRHNAGSN